MEGNGQLAPSALVASARREVKTSLGTVLVRRIGYAALAQVRGQLMDLQSLIGTKTESEIDSVEFLKRPEAGKALESIESIVRLAVLSPALGTDPTVGPVAADFPIADQLLIFSEALDLSGFTRKAAEEVRP